jgi:hypothetical protein
MSGLQDIYYGLPVWLQNGLFSLWEGPRDAIPCRAIGVILSLGLLLNCSVAEGQRPALLVLSPQGTANGWVDLAYLADLHRAGFEVDYTDSLAEVTWDRLRQYNVLVVYTCPPDEGTDVWPFRGKPPIAKDAYVDLIDRFLAAGGGVFVMAVEGQVRATLTRPLLADWGADIPLERIVDDANTAFMTRMPKTPLIYTDRVSPSPVSAGVRGIWYPSHPFYNGAHTLPLATDDHWQVVVRAMPGARTVPVDPSSAAYPVPPHALVRAGGVAMPPSSPFGRRVADAWRWSLNGRPTRSVRARTGSMIARYWSKACRADRATSAVSWRIRFAGLRIRVSPPVNWVGTTHRRSGCSPPTHATRSGASSARAAHRAQRRWLARGSRCFSVA